MKNFLFIILLFPFITKAQEKLIINGKAGDLYVNHTAAPKENFYSIGRMYNISPKEIAPYNKLVLENGINIGRVIKIPLVSENFIQTNSLDADEAAIPLYHKVAANQTLDQLSVNYNKVPVVLLKSWNKFPGDAVIPGRNVVIGYLRVKKDQSPLALKGVEIPTGERLSNKGNEAIAKQVIGADEKPSPVAKVISNKKKQEVSVDMPGEANPSAKNFKAGVFKSLYDNTGKEETGTAGIFKSTSGWEDGKYYCLHNTAPQGAVVKITHSGNGKFIFAKVLDVMPDLGQNNGLTLRLSSAGVNALGADVDKFACTINF